MLIVSGLCQAEDSVLEVIPLQYRPAAELQPLLAPLLDNTDRAIDNGNSIIVKTSPARLESIKNLIKKLDTKISNLMISVIQNSSRSAAELNAEIGLSVTPERIQMSGMSGDTRDLNANRISQSVRTLDGQPALIKTGKVKPIQNTQVYGSVNGYPIINTTTQMVEADSGFAVTPRLSGQQVILDIEPWSDRFQPGNQIETQGARTTIRANLGEWVEIAGNDTLKQQNGSFNGYYQSTVESNLRILVKVDRTN